MTFSLLISSLAGAHSGNTDEYGCHIDHSTGLRHCHNSKDDDSGSGGDVLLIVAGIVAAGAIIWLITKSNKTGLLPDDTETINTSPLSWEFIPNIKEGQIEGIIQFSYSF